MESLLEIESPIAEVIVDDKATLEVQSGAELAVESLPAVSLEIFQSSYAVVVDDIYIKTSVGELPTWLQDKVSLIANNLVSPTALSLNNLWNSHNTLSDGYNLTIASLTSEIETQNTSIENLTTSVGQDLASFQQLIDTKITNTQAQAQIDQSLIAFRDLNLTDSSAWWQNIISTVATDLEAKGNQISVLTAANNNNSASITTVNQVLADHDSAIAKSSQYVTAQVGGTTLITGFALTSSIDPEGEQVSEMVFNAGDFRIYTTTTLPDDTATPVFQATGNEVWFTGKVTFQGLGIDSDTTTIDGGKLTTGSIWADGNVQSNNYNWNAGTPVGFGLFSLGEIQSGQGYNIVGGKIYGATIDGGQINGAVITGQQFKYGENLILLTESDLPTSSKFNFSTTTGTGFSGISRDNTPIGTILSVNCWVDLWSHEAITATNNQRLLSYDGAIYDEDTDVPLLSNVWNYDTSKEYWVELKQGDTVIGTSPHVTSNGTDQDVYLIDLFGIELHISIQHGITANNWMIATIYLKGANVFRNFVLSGQEKVEVIMKTKVVSLNTGVYSYIAQGYSNFGGSLLSGYSTVTETPILKCYNI